MSFVERRRGVEAVGWIEQIIPMTASQRAKPLLGSIISIQNSTCKPDTKERHHFPSEPWIINICLSSRERSLAMLLFIYVFSISEENAFGKLAVPIELMCHRAK